MICTIYSPYFPSEIEKYKSIRILQQKYWVQSKEIKKIYQLERSLIPAPMNQLFYMIFVTNPNQ